MKHICHRTMYYTWQDEKMFTRNHKAFCWPRSQGCADSVWGCDVIYCKVPLPIAWRETEGNSQDLCPTNLSHYSFPKSLSKRIVTIYLCKCVTIYYSTDGVLFSLGFICWVFVFCFFVGLFLQPLFFFVVLL